MNMNTLILVLIAVMALLFVAVVWLAVYLKKHNVSGATVLDGVGVGINYAQSLATAVAPFLPKIADSTITMVLNFAAEATTRVEATFKAAEAANSGAPDTRAAEAKSLITSGLALKGISVTTDISKLIDAVVPLLVLALPKTHTETATNAPATPVTQS